MINSITTNHEQHTLQDVEQASTQSPEEAEKQLLSISGVTEAYVLQTCHRAEAYVNAKDKATANAALKQYCATGEIYGERKTLYHILHTSAGLNSVITGEDEILGQITHQYEESRHNNHINDLLEEIIEHAIRNGKQVRNQTKINEGTTSTASTAVKLAQGYTPLSNKKFLIIGAGEIAQNVCKILENEVDKITVANRTPENIQKIEEQTNLQIKRVDLNNIQEKLHLYNAVITATGSNNPILHKHQLNDKGALHIIDLAQPRDIDPDAEQLNNVEIHDLETVKNMIEENKEQRKNGRNQAVNIVLENYHKLENIIDNKEHEETIQSIMADANQTREKQLEKAYKELEKGEPAEQVIEKLSTSLTNKLLKEPIQSLREGDKKHLKLAEELYNI